MAIIRTGSIFKTLRFGTVDSGDFGIYITGSAVYNAPERAVERVSVPGRNGALIIDQGHFENVPVTYPAGTFATSQSEFAANIGAFRNAVLSQLGYQRLEDDYNPDEYRMANASAGFDVEPAPGRVAGEFELVFDCKPQRFLTAGESETAITASGDAITNPTMFESEPLLVLDGYGKIDFNGYEMEVYNTEVGTVKISESVSNVGQQIVPAMGVTLHQEYGYNPGSFNPGDAIKISGLTFYGAISGVTGVTLQSVSGSGYTGVTVDGGKSGVTPAIVVSFPDIDFVAGTDDSVSYTFTAAVQLARSGGQPIFSYTIPSGHPALFTITHDAANGVISIDWYFGSTNTNYYLGQGFGGTFTSMLGFDSIIGNSTYVTITDSVYIDTEIGEAYIIQGGEPVSVNNSVSIGAELPRLAPGANVVTFDNTFDSVKIRPRWWRL